LFTTVNREERLSKALSDIEGERTQKAPEDPQELFGSRDIF
jgi:hypothetical protein